MFKLKLENERKAVEFCEKSGKENGKMYREIVRMFSRQLKYAGKGNDQDQEGDKGEWSYTHDLEKKANEIGSESGIEWSFFFRRERRRERKKRA